MHATLTAPHSPSVDRNASSARAAEWRPSPRAISGPPGTARAGPYRLTELFRLTDTVIILVVMSAAFMVANHQGVGDFEQFLLLRITVKNAFLCAGFVLLWEAIFTATNRPSLRAECGGPGELTQVCTACTMAALVAALAPLTGLSGSFGLTTVALFWVGSPPATLLARHLVRVATRAAARLAPAREVIIVGSGSMAYMAYRKLCDCPDAHWHVQGFIDTNDRVAFPEIRQRRLGELSDLQQVLMYHNVDLVVIALPVKSQYSAIQEVIQTCERLGVESRYPADIFHGNLGWQQYTSDAGLTSVATKVVRDDVRTDLKRLLDMAAACFGLLVLAPLFAGIAVGIRLTSSGPVFFAQDRYGLNRRIFRMYKFRTMVADAEALQASLEHLNEAAGPVFKIKQDPRVTPFGRALRRTSLDELPQLLNVLKGDMSLVGPRPLPLRDVHHFSDGALMRRFSVRPGLTGLWQVSGRSDVRFDDWISLDLRYIDQWSLGLDIKILLLTIPAVLRGTGAV